MGDRAAQLGLIVAWYAGNTMVSVLGLGWGDGGGGGGGGGELVLRNGRMGTTFVVVNSEVRKEERFDECE